MFHGSRKASTGNLNYLVILLAIFSLVNIGLVYSLILNSKEDSAVTLVDDNLESQGVDTTVVTDEDTVHFVYAIGCGGKSSYQYQFIQSLTLESSFFAYQKYGTLTRLVTGCTNDQHKQTYLNRTVTKDSSLLSRFEVVYTEKFETLPSGNTYVMFNRPNGLLRLFEGTLSSKFVDTKKNDIYIVLDPDFVFRREVPRELIVKGKSMAGYYHMGSTWKKWLETFCRSVKSGEFTSFESIPGGISVSQVLALVNEADCDVIPEISKSISKTKYEGGAPYVMDRQEWIRLLPVWLTMIPIVYNNYYDSIESDMYAWMFASYFLHLDHEVSPIFMRTCMWPESHRDVMTNEVFIHYCQRYHVLEDAYRVNVASEFLRSHEMSKAGEYQHTFSFSKYWLQARGSQLWITDCKSPILVELPEGIYTPTTKLKNHAKVLKEVIKSINTAMVQFKKSYCSIEEMNIEKRMILHEAHKVNKHKLNSILSSVQ